MRGQKGPKWNQWLGLFLDSGRKTVPAQRWPGRIKPFPRQDRPTAQQLPSDPIVSLETYLEVPTYLRWGRTLTLEQHLKSKKRSP